MSNPNPTLCGAVDPERPGLVDDETGEQLTSPVTCIARVQHGKDGKPVQHQGKHRSRVLRGILYRWSDVGEVAQ